MSLRGGGELEIDREGRQTILGAGIMRNVRRYAIVFIIIAAGVITPSPDVFTQSMVAIPIYLLYELSILIAARNERLRAVD